MNDDLYPNDPTFFGGVPLEPVEQIIERKKERAQTLEGATVLKDMINRMDERIAFYEKNSSIPDDVRLDPEQFLIMSNSYKLAAEALQNEKEWIVGLLDANAKNR
jgi:hypothetical protein